MFIAIAMKRKPSVFLKVGLLVGALAWPIISGNAALICREPLAAGYEEPYARATAVLPPITNDMNKIAIYVERAADGKLYFHSNYMTAGFENPTKLAGVAPEEGRDLEAVWEAIVFPPGKHSLSSAEQAAASEAFHKLKLIVDSKLFDKEGRLPLDIDEETAGLSVVDHGGRAPLPAAALSIDGSPPPAWIVRVQGCCMYVKPPARATGLVARLAKVPFGKDQLRFVSLVIDSATEKAIAASRLNKLSAHINLSGNIQAQMADILSQSAGKTLAILGHVENGEFVVQDAAAAIVGRLRISDLHNLAKKYDVSLIEAGCDTAAAANSTASSSLVRIANKFRATDAVKLLDAAVNSSHSYADFVEQLSSPDFITVIDETALGTLHISAYDGLGDDDVNALRLAEFAFRFNSGAQLGNGNSDDDPEVKFDRQKQIYETARRHLMENGEEAAVKLLDQRYPAYSRHE